jgi:hypothetical protein
VTNPWAATAACGLAQGGGRDRLPGLEVGLQFEQRRAFLGGGVAPEAGFDQFEVLQHEVGEGVGAGQDGVGLHRALRADDVDLGMDLLLGLDQLVGLVQAGVPEVVPAGRDAGDAADADLHAPG